MEGNKRRWLIYAAALLIVVLVFWLVWQRVHPAQTVTAISQEQAETPAGVELAAKNAHIEMLQSQLDDAAKQIAELKNKPPDTLIKTVPYEVVRAVEVERKKRGADFAIVTDPTNPDKQVDLKEIEKLPEETAVNLNQYNVYAYKKIIRGVNIYPAWGDAMQGNFKINEITGDISKRITKYGKYIGVAGSYDFENDKAKLGLRYSF